MVFGNIQMMFGRQQYSRAFRLKARIDGLKQSAELIGDDKLKSVVLAYSGAAQQALDDGELERAAQTVLLGERVIIGTYSDSRVNALAASLSAKANAFLPSPEGKPVLDVLGTRSDPKKQSDDVRDLVIEAHDMYEKQVISLYDARERTGWRIFILICALVVLIGGFTILMYTSPDLASKLYHSQEVDNNVLIGAFILGGLGACVSALLTFTSLRQSPSAFEGWIVTLARPLVGAVTGLVAVMFAQASLVTFKSVAAIGLVAFVFGFSERLVMGAVQRLESTR
jgi:hypothetical protein